MAWNEQYSQYPHFNPAFIPPSQHFQSHYASDEPNSRGQQSTNRESRGRSQANFSSASQTRQESNSGFPQWSGYTAAGNGQWSHYYLPNGYSYPIYASSAASQSSAQPQLYSWPASERPSGSPHYPQYGHINPAFLPQPSVANPGQPAATTPSSNLTSGHGRSYTGFGTTYNGGQWPSYGYGYETNQVPMANSQAQPANWQQAWAQYENTIRQYQSRQQQQQQETQQHSTVQTARSTQTRYALRSSQPSPSESKGVRNSLLESLMNPKYMRSPQLTHPVENPRLYLLPRPEPSPTYLAQAHLPPRRLSEPKKLLIVLDLNGTLLLRSNRGSTYTPRPNVHSFLAYCLTHHTLIVWSSARPHNVTAMVNQLFNLAQREQLVKIWSREHLRLGAHYEAKVQVYKQLTWLWDDAEVQASFPRPSPEFKVEDGWKDPPAAKWDQSNTVLIDDSVDKAASEPHNLLQIDEFTKENKNDRTDVLGRVLAYLDGLKWEADVSSAMREQPFVNGDGDEWDWEGVCVRPSGGVKV